MNSYALISEILKGKHTDTTVPVRGFLYRKTHVGGITFLHVRDYSGRIMQFALHRENMDSQQYDEASNLNTEAAVIINAKIVEDKRAPGGYEGRVGNIKVVSNPTQDNYPLKPFRDRPQERTLEHPYGTLNPETVLNYWHLWLSEPEQYAIGRIKTKFVKAIRDYLDKQGFVERFLPVLIAFPVEEPKDMFHTKFHQYPLVLTQSKQFHLEGYLGTYEKVYTLGRTFRGEKSDTPIHAAEFDMLEIEMAFATNEDVMDVTEKLLFEVTRSVMEQCQEEFEILRDTFGTNISEIVTSFKPPYKRLTYSEAIDMLNQKTEIPVEYGDKLTDSMIKETSDLLEKPFFLTEFLLDHRAFYMKTLPGRPEVTDSFDLIVDGIELVTGSAREDDTTKLLKEIRRRELNVQNYEWFLDTRRYTSMPHAGMGLGVDRTLIPITGVFHIRDVSDYPRILRKPIP